MSKKIRLLFLSTVLVVGIGFLSKNYLLPLIFHAREYCYSDECIEELRQTILNDESAKNFIRLFPDARQFVTPQKYYRAGVSSSQFFVVRNIPYLKNYDMNLWLLFFVLADKNNLKFEHCMLRIEFFKKGCAITSFDINSNLTKQILESETEKSFKQYMVENIFNPTGRERGESADRFVDKIY